MPHQTLYCCEYSPYWLAPGVKNPAFTPESGKVLDLKSPQNRNHPAAISHFTGKVKILLTRNGIDLNTFDYIGVVPSSTAGIHSPGLVKVLSNLAKTHSGLKPNLIYRHITVQASHTGGLRSPGIHLASIRLSEDVKGKKILLLDDVTTTGSTFDGCCRLLQENGASHVLCVAIARTV